MGRPEQELGLYSESEVARWSASSGLEELKHCWESAATLMRQCYAFKMHSHDAVETSYTTRKNRVP